MKTKLELELEYVEAKKHFEATGDYGWMASVAYALHAKHYAGENESK